jgi:hypothetical protein
MQTASMADLFKELRKRIEALPEGMRRGQALLNLENAKEWARPADQHYPR